MAHRVFSTPLSGLAASVSGTDWLVHYLPCSYRRSILFGDAFADDHALAEHGFSGDSAQVLPIVSDLHAA
ncbi:hypothetical protein [Paraburkholderia susongensis]|uniref:hypothetical protein n=1 Tax=Paraburkholderia susongensis TaxID=1515439 RepID=UPI00117FA354|nr:hypothetical protein [Paraburkholderia susongensis]